MTGRNETGRVVGVDGLELRRLGIRLTGDDRRVISLPFLTGAATRVRALFERLERQGGRM